MQSNIQATKLEKFSNKLFLLLPFLVYISVYTLFLFFNFLPIVNYTIVYLSSSIIFIFLCVWIFKIHIPENYIIALLALGIILRICLMFIQPTGSDDYTRYVWDGKVLANGINPYRYAPSDTELFNLHSETLPELIKFPEMKTIYPPFSILLFYIGYSIGGESFWGIKILLFLFDLLTIWGLFFILKELKLPLKNILIYVLAPLPLFQFFIDAHVDGFGLSLLIFSILFFLKKRKTLSFIFIGLSICVKPIGLLLLPVIFLIEKDYKSKMKSVVISLMVCLLFYIPFTFSSNVFGSLTNYTINWTFNGFIFEILNSFLSDNQKTRLICGILFALVYILIIISRKDFLIKIYLSFFLLFIFSPVVHPWYVTWLAVLLPFIHKWSGIIYASLISLTVFTVLNYQLYGEWRSYPLILIFEYIPVLIIFIYELYRIRNHKGIKGS